ncbi:hypothetical protein R9X47_18230 [Wukongibacter baidiensis]|uniref:glycoside hydrolase family 78 protein n=1 Tax=Wukongibacter baidiensis TaxID=1723361 RepID=UPI003D7FB0C6
MALVTAIRGNDQATSHSTYSTDTHAGHKFLVNKAITITELHLIYNANGDTNAASKFKFAIFRGTNETPVWQQNTFTGIDRNNTKYVYYSFTGLNIKLDLGTYMLGIIHPKDGSGGFKAPHVNSSHSNIANQLNNDIIIGDITWKEFKSNELNYGGLLDNTTDSNDVTTEGDTGFEIAVKVVYGEINAPNTPTNLNPGSLDGSGSEKVQSLIPSMSWSYSDPEGDPQVVYQVIIYKKSDDTIVYNTDEVISSNTSFTLPSGLLSPNTEYYWKVRVKDSRNWSDYSTVRYFKTTKAPTVTSVSPLGTQENPEGSNLISRLAWNYDDAENHTQSHSHVVIKDINSTVVHDTEKTANINQYYDVPNGVLTAGEIYSWTVTVWDNTDMQSLATPEEYFITNIPPETPTIDGPVDTKRVGKRPIFEATAADDIEDNHQAFVLQIADDSNFTINVSTFDSTVDTSGWEYYGNTSWNPFPVSGKVSAASIEGNSIRYIIQQDLNEGNDYSWRLAAKDGTTDTIGVYSNTRSIRCGNILAFEGKNPNVTSVSVARIVFSAVMTIPNDGIVPAALKVEVCNNALDALPTWEDCTEAFNSGEYYLFINKTKTADNWAVNYRITIEANDSLESIEVDAIGFSFD